VIPVDYVAYVDYTNCVDYVGYVDYTDCVDYVGYVDDTSVSRCLPSPRLGRM
jgi:hypothetical protein